MAGTEHGGAAGKVAGERKTHVFLSYSRRDGDFAERLRERLLARGFEAYLDKHDIAPGEDWRARLGGLIENADTIVFLISPDSVASDICDWEVNHAELLGKRVLPVVHREPEHNDVPERLRRLNYVFMRTDAEEESGFSKLESALSVDIAWIRTHTRYGEMAREWDRSGRAARLLLRGKGIDEAEAWRDRRPSTAPDLTDEQSAFIAASRKAATNRQRGWIGGASTVAAGAIALSVYAFFQQQEAEASRQETTRVLATADYRQGSLLAEDIESEADGTAFLARAARSGDQRAQARLWTMLQQKSFWQPAGVVDTAVPEENAPPVPAEIAGRFARVEWDGQPVEVVTLAASGDGRLVFTGIGSAVDQVPVKVRIWEADGAPVTDWLDPPFDGEQYLSAVKGYFSTDGSYLAVEMQDWRAPSAIALYDVGRMEWGKRQVRAEGSLPQTQFAAFDVVRLVTRPGSDEVLLLTASQRGNVAVHRVDPGNEYTPTSLSLLAASAHRARVTFATLDEANRWLISGDADRLVRVTGIGDDTPVGGLLRLDDGVVGARRDGDGGLVVGTADGKSTRFELKKPVRLAVPRAMAATPTPEEACLSRSHEPDARTVLKLGSGGTAAFDGERGLIVSLPGAAPVRSPRFESRIDLICANAAGSVLSVTSNDFRTEVWAADLSRRLGPALDEQRFHRPDNAPDSTVWVQLSDDGAIAFVMSQFTDSPNGYRRWFTLWDTATGQLMMDPQLEYDSELPPEDENGDPVPGEIQTASLDAGTGWIHFFSYGKPVRALQFTPPASSDDWLPTFAEGRGGNLINQQGAPERVADRSVRLADGEARLDALAGPDAETDTAGSE